MHKVLIVDNSARDAQRFQNLLAKEGVEVEVCLSGAEAERMLASSASGFAAAVILWNLPPPILGFDLIIQCRRLWPDMPVVVMSESLDASMATRAYAFGARDFLEKPLDSERIVSCIRSLLAAQDPLSPLVQELRKTILGQSPAILDALRQVAKVIPHKDSRVLLIGESGTGKELFAQAIHKLGQSAEPEQSASRPCVAVNINGIPSELIESALFGHEKGAFTGATDRHTGFFEEADEGTVFLDEIGDLELPLQTKLLRVIQEKKFRPLKGKKELDFKARLVCATNRDLAAAVNQGTFRRDLFHRIAEITIQVPPLRERKGDVDFLLGHFLDAHRGERRVRFARETLTILRSYPFMGNVREMENLVRSALIECEGDLILPQHLPLKSMGTLLVAEDEQSAKPTQQENRLDHLRQKLIEELLRSLPDDWTDLAYREAAQHCTQAFDRVYLQRKLERWRHNVTQAARKSGVDAKTFRKRWKECGLPPLGGEEDSVDE